MELVLGAILVSEEFGLSRPLVRELIRQMVAEGYLELEQNRPVRIAAFSFIRL
ncbi:TPA: GntR family transcriptional regulator [Acinetobacter baumannii]|nr:GntR family transcriptional regulator [Acinetobacter baumannii]